MPKQLLWKLQSLQLKTLKVYLAIVVNITKILSKNSYNRLKKEDKNLH